jgi:hypothetical protein
MLGETAQFWKHNFNMNIMVKCYFLSLCRSVFARCELGNFRGRRFIDLNTTASKNELTSHIINWRIFVYIYALG